MMEQCQYCGGTLDLDGCPFCDETPESGAEVLRLEAELRGQARAWEQQEFDE